LDLSNSRELSGEVLRVLDQVVSVFVEFSERLAHFFKLVASHGRSIGVSVCRLQLECEQAACSEQGACRFCGAWRLASRFLPDSGTAQESPFESVRNVFNDAETMGKFRRA
jgi:hypothetical protein